MVSQPLAGGQYSCELASEGTHLLDDGRPPLFSSAWGVLLFVAVVLCFRQWIDMWGPFAFVISHSRITFVVVRLCSYSFIVRFVCWYRQPSQGGGGKISSVMDCQGAGEVAGRGLLTGVLPLSSWVHPSSCVIVIRSLLLSNSYRRCRICFVIKSALWLLW